MGNPDSSWWYERDGIIHPAGNVSFAAEGLRTGLEVVANKLGKKLDEDNPVLNAQLPDGSRLAAVIPPVVRPAPALVIRKFSSRKFTLEDLIARGTLTRELADLLAEQIAAGKTILISGGTGSGKTTLLNILAQAIPASERIVIIEGTAELSIKKPNILAVECQTDTYKSPVSFDDLLRSALRWRPDRSARPAISFRARSQFADKLRALVAKEGISLEYDKSIAPAQGVSLGGKIRLQPDMQPAEEFSVLAHELAHELLHHSRAEDSYRRPLLKRSRGSRPRCMPRRRPRNKLRCG